MHTCVCEALTLSRQPYPVQFVPSPKDVSAGDPVFDSQVSLSSLICGTQLTPTEHKEDMQKEIDCLRMEVAELKQLVSGAAAPAAFPLSPAPSPLKLTPPDSEDSDDDRPLQQESSDVTLARQLASRTPSPLTPKDKLDRFRQIKRDEIFARTLSRFSVDI